MLLDLLHAIGRQKLCDPQTKVEIVVVDNDQAHSALAVLNAWRGPPGFTLVFLHEPEPNISVARNAAIHRASGDWIVFVDDDETPETDWLLRLLETQRHFQADAVFGPVVPRYGEHTPKWVLDGAYFDRRRFETGTRIDEADARTGNVLIKADWLRSLQGPFDKSFGHTGGEDSLLFRDLLARGCRFVWCDEAIVSEEVPLDRANVRWLLRRSFRVGQTWIRAELYRLTPGTKIRRGVVLSLRASVQLVAGLALALVWMPVSPTKSFRWIRISAMQAGKITGMSHFQYREYGT
jgi:succinoglycan biosynthesis protein ExoM